jgi:hypothetical protein
LTLALASPVHATRLSLTLHHQPGYGHGGGSHSGESNEDFPVRISLVAHFQACNNDSP